ncbi:MAG: (Fe-S)-binding protein [Deltaproteobacteria bacterium]|nr:MAG: (Fe-S)-binding protein [Deltaproteobacteria bacterium]
MDLIRLKSLKTDMEKCFRCSLCKMIPLPVVRHPEFTDACPASRLFHFHGYSGSGKQIMALSLLDGRIEPDEALARAVFTCTACGYCDVACKFIMDAERHRVNMVLREHLVDRGLSPPAHKKVRENLRTYGNPKGRPERTAGAWAEGLGLKVLPERKAEVLLFAGCVPSNDPQSAEVVRKLARLLLHAGVDLGILGDAEPGCGLPAYWMGDRDLFTKMASDAVSIFSKTNVRTIVAASGSCLGAFRSKYPEYARAPDVEVLHATEFLLRLISEGRLSLPRPVRARVTYQDPCYLGRQSEPYAKWEGVERTALGVMTYTDPPKPVSRGVKGVYEPPRQILRAIPGIEFNEMYRIREYSFCCGAGGGVPAAYPELARSAAQHRLTEARAVGGELLVTACAYCEAHFRRVQEDGGSQKQPEKMKVVDIIELVYEAAGLDG